MKTLKIVVLSIAALLLGAQLHAQAVRLQKGQPFSYAVSGFSWYQTYVDVHAPNYGAPASRHVYVHYNLNKSGVWQQAELTLAGDYGDHSRYTLTLPSAVAEYALNFVWDGGSEWDNNGGSNYRTQPWTSFGGYIHGAVGGNVGLKSAQTTSVVVSTRFGAPYIVDDTISGEIYVQNNSYGKDVGIIVTYGAPNASIWPWVWVPATYSYSLSTGGGSNIEVWTFSHKFYGHPNSHPWKFAVYYDNHDTGVWSWDNNFGQDYSIAKSGGNIQ